jgi:hypothetical protein
MTPAEIRDKIAELRRLFPRQLVQTENGVFANHGASVEGIQMVADILEAIVNDGAGPQPEEGMRFGTGVIHAAPLKWPTSDEHWLEAIEADEHRELHKTKLSLHEKSQLFIQGHRVWPPAESLEPCQDKATMQRELDAAKAEAKRHREAHRLVMEYIRARRNISNESDAEPDFVLDGMRDYYDRHKSEGMR